MYVCMYVSMYVCMSVPEGCIAMIAIVDLMLDGNNVQTEK